MTLKQRIKGSILGGMIGDAIGATFEFKKSADAQQLLRWYDYLSKGLVGGGPFNLKPGQFTDDTEMALAIMSTINQYGLYDQNKVAAAYYAWYLSEPIDIGKTTKTAISQQTANKMIWAAKTVNAESLSNGFLMRLYGLVALYQNRTLVEVTEAALLDVQLTHSHPEALSITIVYVGILYKAVNGVSAPNIYQWAKKNARPHSMVSNIIQSMETSFNRFSYSDQIWDIKNIDTHSIGFVGYAIWLLFKCLLHHQSYRDAMLDIVSRGGDTDTNACIVGAVMGALYPDTIPDPWMQSVTMNRCDRHNTYPLSNPAVWQTYFA